MQAFAKINLVCSEYKGAGTDAKRCLPCTGSHKRRPAPLLLPLRRLPTSPAGVPLPLMRRGVLVWLPPAALPPPPMLADGGCACVIRCRVEATASISPSITDKKWTKSPYTNVCRGKGKSMSKEQVKQRVKRTGTCPRLQLSGQAFRCPTNMPSPVMAYLLLQLLDSLAEPRNVCLSNRRRLAHRFTLGADPLLRLEGSLWPPVLLPCSP
jgi:hypothetical protein